VSEQESWVKPVTLRGERALLVPLEEAHVKGLADAGAAPEIWHYMPAWPSSAEEMRAVVEQALRLRDAGAEMPFTIIDQADGRIVGSTRYLEITPAHRGLEIGWSWLTPEVWRTRINTECKLLLLRHAFEELGAIRVQLKTDLRNARSQAAIARIGGVREGVLRQHRIMPDGYLRDTVYFSILDHEWPVVRARLEGFLQR
jgi:RimJ/RimL family protein N-acetyltransferase